MLVGERCKDIKIVLCWATNHSILEGYINDTLKKYPEDELLGIDVITGKYTKKEITQTINQEGSFLVSVLAIKRVKNDY